MGIKFGMKGVNSPTPRSVANLMDGLAGFLGIVNAWLLTAAYISHDVSDVMGSLITGLLIPSLLYFKKFFSVEMPENKKDVPVSDVSEIKDK